MAPKFSKTISGLNLMPNEGRASTSRGPGSGVQVVYELDLETRFDVQIPSGPDVMLGMSGDEIQTILKNTDRQLKARDKLPCAACGNKDLYRYQLVHLASLRRGKFGYERTSCYDCIQCTGPDGAAPWYWAMDGHGDLDHGNAATFVPIPADDN